MDRVSPKGRLRLLIAEDSERDTELARVMLEDAGYNVEFRRVETVEEFSAAATQGRWDLVLSDHSMPGFSSLTALGLLQKHDLDLPFIVVSGQIGEDAAVAAMKAGAHDYVMKDNLTRLVPAIERELREAEDRRKRRAAEAALREIEDRYRLVFDSAPIGICLSDLNGYITAANQAYQKMLGYTDVELCQTQFTDFTHPDDIQADLERFQHAKRDAIGGYEMSKRFVHKDGHEISAHLTVVVLRDAQGHPSFNIAMIEDITERKRAEDALVHQAMHDSLTNLPNRVVFRDRVEQAILGAKRENTCIAVLLMDLDRFKEVNDTLGHHYGDGLLQQVGERIRSALRGSDTVARLGGDEFGILMSRASGVGVTSAARKILSTLGERFTIENHMLDVRASIGIALWPKHGEDESTLVRHADVAMYVAKGTANGYAVYSPGQDRNSPDRMRFSGELREAIGRNQLILHYQPQMNLRTGQIDSVEALARWFHPEHGFIPPDRFIPLTEDTGLIEVLTDQLLERAVRQCRSWADQGLTLRVAVNVSAHNLRDGRLPDVIRSLLEKYDVAPAALTLEITESVVMENRELALTILTNLHEMGVGVSIDDFGTGYSSLGYLKRLPAVEIKVDRSFVIDMMDDDDDMFIVPAIVDLGHNLGLRVVAEGVETRPVLDSLRSMVCDSVQGYYLSRPLPADELTPMLANQELGPSLSA